MRTLKYFVLTAVALALVGGAVAYRAAEDKVKDIETIMDKAHKGDPSLYKTVVTGKADKEQKEELLALYTDLGKNKPPKGSAEDWKKRTDAMVAAAKAVVGDKPDATKALQKAVNCKGCHELHKED
jgi:hypothetical protein